MSDVTPVTLRRTLLGKAQDLLKLHALHPERYPHLLASHQFKPSQTSAEDAVGAHNDRYTLLFAFPEDTLCLTQEGLTGRLRCLEDETSDEATFAQRPFLEAFDAWFKQEQASVECEADVPFMGGWFVYLGYELAQEIEPCLNLPLPENQPIAFATRFRSALVVDYVRDELALVQEHQTGEEQERITAQLEQVKADLAQSVDTHFASGHILVDEITEDEPQRYLQSVEKVKQYIKDGDVFQVNLSRLWQVQLNAQEDSQAVSSTAIFASLRQKNPSPFSALVHFPNLDLISSSPERLVSVRNGVIETRPIAGTRPRIEGQDEQAMTEQLISHPKERAEHIMLIDLERNDLGRVCKAGTVEVNELMALETYAHVHHIVSNVKGELRADITPAQAIRATFPGGTITGCPKVRCMEILAELEQQPRGAYTGSVGYINRDGSMDLNILIRSLVREGNQLHLRAGGGIVMDSNPERELNETRAKAKGLLSVFELTNGQ